MRKYRYQITLIITIFIVIITTLVCKNTINLNDYLVVYYSKCDEGYKPNISLNYIEFAEDLGGMTNEKKEKLSSSENILSLLSTMFVSDYSSLINSIQINYDESPVKDGDKIKVKITWDETLEEKCGLNLISYNNTIRVKSPELNTITAGIGSAILNLNLLDESKEYFTIIPLSDGKELIKSFEKYNIKNYDNNYVTLENKTETYTVKRHVFEKYFVSNYKETINTIVSLDFSDIKSIISMIIINTLIVIFGAFLMFKITKDKSILKSFHLSNAIIILMMIFKIKDITPLDYIFKIPSAFNWDTVYFCLIVFVLIGLIFEIITFASYGVIKCIIFTTLLVIFNVFSIFSIIAGFLLILFDYFILSKKDINKDKNNIVNEKILQNTYDYYS